MSGATLTTLDAILKTDYIGPIREQLNNTCALYSRLEKNEDSVEGKKFTIPLHCGRNEGIGARAEGGALPAAGNQQYKDCLVPMRHQYGRFQLTGQAIKSARSNDGSFARAIDSEIRGLERDMKASMNRQAFGDGSGLLATCASASSATAITVDSTAKLRIGMPVSILVKTTGAVTAGVASDTVASITSATAFTLTTGVATAGNIGSTYGVYVAGSRNNEMMGLAGIVSASDPGSGALQGLDVATNPWWKANVFANGGATRAISDTILQKAIDSIEMNSSGSATALYTSYGVRQAYVGVLNASRQIVNTMDLKGGYKAITYNGLPIIADKDAPAGKIFVVDENELCIYRLADFDWMQEDGSIMSRVSGYDAYEAVLYAYQELGTSMRNAHALISDITEA